MAASILIVEDDQAMADLVKDALTQQGFGVKWLMNAEQALKHIRKDPPDLLVLDVGLPGFSGTQLCEAIRKDAHVGTLPVIMLTNQSRQSQKVHGLEAGADDYITKPFDVRELIARVHAVLRRHDQGSQPAARLEGGGITIDSARHEVSVRGKALELRPKEYALLELFLKRKGQVLSRSVIAESVWGDDRIVTSENIKWWIHELREKLGPAGSQIEAVTTLGYKFVEKR